MHEIFQHLARRSPEAVAVVADGADLSYGELDHRAEVVADRLRALGVRPEMAVGLCLPPTAALAVAILACLKVGAAFVPVDPDYPADRLRTLLADARPKVIATVAGLPAALPRGVGTPLELGRDGACGPGAAAAGRAGQPGRAGPWLTGDAAACVIYTSGSTGGPKGVVITHRGLVNLARAAVGRLGLRPGDRFLQLASVSFSAFLEEFFPSLLCGGTVVLAGYRQALTSVPHLLHTLATERISGFEITTAYWHEVVDEMSATGARFPPSLRFVIMGSEVPRRDCVQCWRQFKVPLVHVYGPTEATATATYLHTDEYDPVDGRLPIGTAIPDTAVHLLDRRMRPVPDGTPGELYVGGQALARGYHHRPGATAERFVPDLHGPPGGRLYRTGDLALRLPDGNLAYHGRIDAQIKIRGHRIEPAEVEQALVSHSGVRSCVVVARGDRRGDRTLVAYLVPAAEQPTVNGLRAYLSELLPGYMVPSFFVALDALPLNPNGKIDREALPPVPTQRPDLGLAPAAPVGETEQSIVGIFADTLDLNPVGVTDDFFDLGGHSLLATRVLARLRAELGVELTLRDMFAARTPRALARLADGRATAAGTAGDTARRWRAKRALISRALAAAGGGPDCNRLSRSQEGLWVLSQLAPDIALYSVPIRLGLSGPLDAGALECALTAAVARHEALRTRFDTVAAVPVQVVDPAAPVPLAVHDLRPLAAARRAARAAEIALAEAARPFDLTAGPLFRGALIRTADEEYELLCNAHHLVFDGPSAEVFLHDLSAGYRTASGSGPDPAGPPGEAPQYPDFAVWQRDHLRGDRLEGLLGYWRDRLRGAPPLLCLPADRPRRGDGNFAGANVRRALPLRQRDAVAALAREQEATFFIVALAAFVGLMHRLSHAAEVCVGVPVANRARPEFERMVGFFVNHLVIRVGLGDDPDMLELLRRTRAACLDAYDHQDLPFDLLVAELNPARVAGANPLFQVNFSAEDAPGLHVRIPALAVRPGSEISSGHARFDLAWLMENHGDFWEASVDYSTDLFDRRSVTAMINDYQAMVESLTTEPHRRLSQVALSADQAA